MRVCTKPSCAACAAPRRASASGAPGQAFAVAEGLGDRRAVVEMEAVDRQRVHAGARHLLDVGEEALLALPGQAVDEVGVGDQPGADEPFTGGEGFVRRVAAVDRAEDAVVEALDPHADAADPLPAQHLDVARRQRFGRRLDGVHAIAESRRPPEDGLEQLVEQLGTGAVGVPPPTSSCASGVPVPPLQLALQGADERVMASSVAPVRTRRTERQ
jgi:hypothetical protein